ncbi:hypothetical protein [Cytobacillus sp. IB215665]|uniref:hypothetical protein n=1 Tax=Cytobacillus sp. IB215665 TaxID=3097357 RepID=UPI002A1843E2|nr:hypothetical protein [Cytobacillus sp. IB215665]MDX8363731.1 hypothetical protein [Cytobacillus sp. IB215665]
MYFQAFEEELPEQAYSLDELTKIGKQAQEKLNSAEELTEELDDVTQNKEFKLYH